MGKGYIQVYTGNGKGKTTSALGLSLRAVCSGKKVFFGQFMKGQPYSELKAAELLEGLDMEQFGGQCFVEGKPTEQDILDAHLGLSKMKDILASGVYDVVVFDELNTAMFFQLVSVAEVMAVLDLKPDESEVIITGRYAPEKIIERADLVTEMREIKHYYNQGVQARKGIEN